MELDDRIDAQAGYEPAPEPAEDGVAEKEDPKQTAFQRWEQALNGRMKELDQRAAELSERETLLDSREEQAAVLEERLKEQKSVTAERERSLLKREDALTAREESLEKRSKLVEEKAAALAKRESKTLDRELDISKRENDLLEQQAELDGQRSQAREQIRKAQLEAKAAFENTLAEERARFMAEMCEQMEARRREFEESLTERERSWQRSVQERMDEQLKTAQAEAEGTLRQAEESAKQEIQRLTQETAEKASQTDRRYLELDKKREELNERESELQRREDELDAERRKIARETRHQKSKDEELEAREQDLETAVKERISSRIASFNQQIADKDRELAEVRERCRQFDAERDSIERFKVSIGETPEIIRDRQDRMRQEIDQLRKELSRRAPESLERNYRELEKQKRQLTAELEEARDKVRSLEQRNRELSQFEGENIGLASQNQSLRSVVEELRAQSEQYRQRIERLSTGEARLSDYEARVAEIRKGFLPPIIGVGQLNEASEIDWLQTISERCAAYGVSFPRRILYAFHTALKISDWSSITVLAGVSGTGKSELPKLYAAFGGMNFISVPVQPNWDSQESMLGFFNSIDNRFEPEDLLRFLVQCTEDKMYSQYMSIVLLDEMNLAHVELYFADFLSKLESRRGSSKNDLPSVEVKLGAGVQPYRLNLVRSILWTGTMNQDETTKSLSDKVLDRGLVINFPRPRTLRGRKNMLVLGDQIKDRPMLTKKAWSKWLVREIKLEGEQRKEMEHYREIVERINDELEHVGRALGHRVWQSIEYYIMNYPTVCAEHEKLKQTHDDLSDHGEMSMELKRAMKIAFEDQIVQKIMPKLRGVETRGKAKTNLDAIEALLEQEGFETLKDDFEIACEQGYGQFIWSSAKYIEADEAENGCAEPDDGIESVAENEVKSESESESGDGAGNTGADEQG